MHNFFDITNKKMMLTGGSGDLGSGMAEALMDAGAEVALIDVSDRIYTVCDAFAARGFRVHAVKGDLGTPEGLKTCFNEALAALGGEVDALFNVAGIQRRHKSEEFPLEDWNAVININLTVPFLMSQLAAREMIKRSKGGKIINIASMLSFFGGYTVPAYSASKGGVAQLTKAFCNEWARYGINVNAIAPGYMDTQMNVNLINDEGRNAEILARIPAGRWGTSEDVKGVAIFLASQASDYLNGAIIPVDGGYMVK
ncbi:MAG: SDR family oxidoreductase [Eubacteriales bacterium]|nr:SDR family oxidoreductase [Eubacteriales bacterium]